MLFGRRERRIIRLLVVEDEPLVAFDNERALQDADFEVVATVSRADAAIAALVEGAIDLVVSDVQLAEGSGVDVARAAGERGVPVLFVTGSCPPEARTLALGCLAKPYSPRDLMAAIDVVDAHLAGENVRRLPSGFTLFAAPAQAD